MRKYTKNNDSSSMHIVIFTGGMYPAPDLTKKYWQSIIVPDYVIAADSGLSVCREYEDYYSQDRSSLGLEGKRRPVFAPNLILGDMDSLEDSTILANYSSKKIRIFKQDKNLTDTELAVLEAYKIADKNKKKPFITLVGGDGGRVDHLLGIYDMFSSKKHPSVWLCSCMALWYAAASTEFEIGQLEPEDIISIARINSSWKGGKIKSCGLEWESNKFRKTGMPSISNRISKTCYKEKRPVKLFFKKKKFILFLPFTAEVAFLRRGN